MTRFYKVSGSGNDFLALAEPWETPSAERIRAWCRRGVSIGADGLFVLRRAESGATMDYFNADGPGGCVLFSAHEGEGEVVLDEFVGRPVPMIASLFGLSELVALCGEAELHVSKAERRAPYSDEKTTRLYVSATR